MLSRVAAVVGLVLLTALSVVRVTRPPAPRPASAPDTVFSAERALRHVEQIAQRPHPMGTADHDRVRDYIVGQLSALGVRTEVQTTSAVGTRYQEAGVVQNVVGYLPGSAPSGKAVLITVHYDGVEASPAAADDGAGVAALLEVARALRARRTPLRQDVIALFTDGEESGLLGAAAFVRDHPRAKDVGFVLNFEARGTAGRSLMFETGPGNLDAARMLRAAGDVSAGSVFITVYRALPNDTDLSELARLGAPMMNFAFIDGVERYHTSHDDVAHLDRGSLQHHGAQMLAVATKVGSGELPRPATDDAVFFDLPLIGLVVYPIWVAYPLAALVLVLFILVIWREWPKALFGVAGPVVGVLVCASLAGLVRLSGPALWSGRYAAVIALAAVALNAGWYLFAERRWQNGRLGGLALWTVLAVTTTAMVPAVSYLFAWPVLFALVAARSGHPVAEWISAGFALILLAGVASTAAAVMLGVAGAGGIVLAAFTALLTWLIGPLVARIFADWRWALGVPLAAAVVVGVVAKQTVELSADHPARSALVYAENEDDGTAFFGSVAPREPWTNGVLRDVARGPSWTASLGPARQALYGHPVPRVPLEGSSAAIVGDSTAAGERTITVRLGAPRGTTAVVMRATGVRVVRTSIDGRPVNTARFRRPSAEWVFEYWNVPPEGALVSLTVAEGAHGRLELAARRPGLPSILQVPARPDRVVPSQSGDVSVAYRTIGF